MHDARTWTLPVSLYICPSRRQPIALPAHDDARGAYVGGGWDWGKTDYAANAWVVPMRPRPLLHAWDITDGLSYTLLAGEKAMDPDYYSTGSWYWDEPFFLGGSDSTSRKGNVLLRDNQGRLLPGPRELGFAAPLRGEFPLLRRLRQADRLRHGAANHSGPHDPGRRRDHARFLIARDQPEHTA